MSRKLLKFLKRNPNNLNNLIEFTEQWLLIRVDGRDIFKHEGVANLQKDD